MIFTKNGKIATQFEIEERMRYAEEELECIKMYMDRNNYPKADKDGNLYSYVGRMIEKERGNK